MEDSCLGEIRLFGFDTQQLPKGWMACDGQKLLIREHQALFSLLGNRFGGDGKIDFCLPDLRGRLVVGANAARSDYRHAAVGGTERVSLSDSQMPAHTHAFRASTSIGNGTGPGTNKNRVLACDKPAAPPAKPDVVPIWGQPKNLTGLAPAACLPSGEGVGHDNRQPYLALNFCICVDGTYPPRQ